MKLQTKVKTQVEQEILVDIELPYYFKRYLVDNEIIMIESESRVVSAYAANNYTSLYTKRLNADVIAELQKGTQCTEQEFNQVYETALANIQNLQEA